MAVAVGDEVESYGDHLALEQERHRGGGHEGVEDSEEQGSAAQAAGILGV